MSPIDLLNLAEQADREGRFAIADNLTQRATRIADNWFTSGLKSLFNSGMESAEKLGLTKEMLGQGKFPLNQLEKVKLNDVENTLNILKDIRPGLPQKTVANINFFRSEAELKQIAESLMQKLKLMNSADEETNKAIQKLVERKTLNHEEQKKIFNEAINKGLVQRNSRAQPEDIIALLKGEPLKEGATRQGLKPWINNTAKGVAGVTALGTGYGLYNATKQQNALQPGSNYSDPGAAGSPFGEGQASTGSAAPMMNETPMQGGGQAGYQGPTYNMPSANQSFQPMQGYQPANQVRELPRTNDQAEPLYPRITPQQAMQNAMTEDQARRYRELMEQGNRPAAAPIVGGNQEIYGPTQEMANTGGVSYEQSPTTTEYLPAPPVTEGTNDPNANVIYTPETLPRTENYQLT